MAQAPMAMITLQFLRKIAKDMHVFRVAQPAFDDADIAIRTHRLDVGERGAVELDVLKQAVNNRSSISRKDMWQPKHPASEVVATLSFFVVIQRPSVVSAGVPIGALS